MVLRSLGGALVIAGIATGVAFGQVQLGKTPQPALKIEHGQPDKAWIEFKQESKKLVAEVFLDNDQPIAGGQIPLRYGDGKAPLDVDSVVFDQKRAGKFDFTNDGIDSVNQTMRIGFIADISGRKPPLEKGKGGLLTIYFNLKTNKPYEVVLDTTTLSGGYGFLFVDQAAQSIPATFEKGKFKINKKGEYKIKK